MSSWNVSVGKDAMKWLESRDFILYVGAFPFETGSESDVVLRCFDFWCLSCNVQVVITSFLISGHSKCYVEKKNMDAFMKVYLLCQST